MKFLMIVKASPDSEAGKMPSEELLTAMGNFNKEMMDAGILRDAAGLHPSSKGARVKFSRGQTSVIEGPFAETKELVGGYWIVDVASREEAIAWARKAPSPGGEGKEAEIEIRQFFELEDFGQCPAIDQQRELSEQLAAGRQA